MYWEAIQWIFVACLLIVVISLIFYTEYRDRHCPKCGSKKVKEKWMIFDPIYDGYYRKCLDCGHEYGHDSLDR